MNTNEITTKPGLLQNQKVWRAHCSACDFILIDPAFTRQQLRFAINLHKEWHDAKQAQPAKLGGLN